MIVLTKYQVELLRDLMVAGVDYVIIGGKAMQAYDIDRLSRDLDVWVSCEPRNAERLFPVLAGRVSQAALPSSPAWLASPGRRVVLRGDGGIEEADVLTSIHDLDFASVLERSNRSRFEDLDVSVASVGDLARIKQLNISAGQQPSRQARDRADLVMLREIQECPEGT